MRYRPKSQQQERAALQLLQERDILAPRCLALLPFQSGSLLLQSYIEEIDLAALLTRDPARPLLPVEVSLKEAIREEEPAPAIRELGGMLARQHIIFLPQFGHLAQAEDPNPYRTDARMFTLREARQALRRCQDQEWISDLGTAERLSTWLYQQCVQFIDPSEAPCLIHGDLYPSNIRISRAGESWSLTGMMDYEHAKALLRSMILHCFTGIWVNGFGMFPCVAMNPRHWC